MIFTWKEIFDIVVMTIAIAYIFKDYFPKHHHAKEYDPLDRYTKKTAAWFEDLKMPLLVAAPAIILHEFGHKFIAMAFGLDAEFNAAYTFLIIGLILKLLKFPFLIIVPAYVSYPSTALASETIWIALAGPLVNFVLWLASWYILKFKKVPAKYHDALVMTKMLNGFLCVFNLIPIPGFDGSHVVSSLVDMFR
ncbi:MAG TPA: M50 family metallopeptidase [Acidobacteriota bacterium]|nr:M50 family metallopeptidase [Acidobacteriota bacterium]